MENTEEIDFPRSSDDEEDWCADTLVPKSRQVLVDVCKSKNYNRKFNNRVFTKSAEDLKKKAETLIEPNFEKSTVRFYESCHRFFNEFCASINKTNRVTVPKVLLFIADMVERNHTTNYIRSVVNSLRHHENMRINSYAILKDDRVVQAFKNAGKRLENDDSRVPLLTTMIPEYSEIIDAFASVKNAIMVKCFLWVGVTCMLRRGEYSLSGVQSYPVTVDRIRANERGIYFNFEGWKKNNRRRGFLFPWIGDTQEVALRCFKNYVKVRATIKTDSDQFFIVDDGSPLGAFMLDAFLHTMTDHSSYKGLRISSHSIRIGGATSRHLCGESITELMRLGRWADNTIFNYLRPELVLPPEELLKMPEFRSRRKEEHSLCSCTGIEGRLVDNAVCTATYTVSKSSKFTCKKGGFFNKKTGTYRQKEYTDSEKVKYIKCRTGRRIGNNKDDSGKPPVYLERIQKWWKVGLHAWPYVSKAGIDVKYVDKHYDGNWLWFSIAVNYCMRKLRNYQVVCKYHFKKAGLEWKTRPHFNSDSLAENIPNTEALSDVDKDSAKAVVDEYNNYILNMSEAQRNYWDNIKPTATKRTNLFPNNFEVSKTFLEAAEVYRKEGELNLEACKVDGNGKCIQGKKRIENVTNTKKAREVKKKLALNDGQPYGRKTLCISKAVRVIQNNKVIKKGLNGALAIDQNNKHKT